MPPQRLCHTQFVNCTGRGERPGTGGYARVGWRTVNSKALHASGCWSSAQPRPPLAGVRAPDGAQLQHLGSALKLGHSDFHSVYK